MKFEINCPHCNTKLQVTTDWSGQRMACSACSGEFVVPQVGGDSGKAPPPRPNAPTQGARRAARGGGRKSSTGGQQDSRIGEPRFTSERHHTKRAPVAEILLVIAVILFLGFFIYKFVTREKKSLFDVAEETTTRTWTLSELADSARTDTLSEERYRKYVRNLARVDTSTTEGKEHERQNKDAISSLETYLTTQLTEHCQGADEGMVRAAVEKVFGEWESDEQAKVKAADARRAAAQPADGGEEKPKETELPPPEDDGLTPEQKVDRAGRTEIQDFVKTLEIPESYAQRGQWLAGELAKLRDQANSSGLGLEKLTYHSARLEELFAAFDRWAKPTERSKESFKWAKSSVDAVVALQRNWKAGLSDEKVQDTLRTLVDRLKDAESKFTD